MEIDQNVASNDSQQSHQQAQPAKSSLHSDSVQAWIPTKNPASLVSYYAGIFGLLPFVGLPGTVTALIAGVIALNKYKQNPTPGAKVHAIVGIILGAVQIAVFLIFITSLVLT